MTGPEKQALEAFSNGELTALDLRRQWGGITYGGILHSLSEHDLPLPRASQKGREEQIKRARSWILPKNVV